mmetsp:Transcript_28795/g.66965  ORF Transcript_28795/g.66965 Transcript_28795/m.66965 type:complete len:1122 (-) Transcript_28795:125-3490(-)
MVAAATRKKTAAAAKEEVQDEENPASGLESFSIEAFVGGQAGVLPAAVKGCWYDANKRNWIPGKALKSVPAEVRGTLLRGYTHLVEKARSKASVCKRCGENIPKDSLRVCYPVQDHRGDYGAIPLWLHYTCARADATLKKHFQKGDSLGSKLLGYDALTGEEQEELRKEMLRDEAVGDEEVQMPAVPAARSFPQAEKPAALKVPMLPFQAEGLYWMLQREEDRTTKGGVLADEMGMGKTLQMIALLLAGKSQGPNLVICPAAAMLQWRNEVTRFVEPGALGVELYYGHERKGQDFNDKGNIVVLTTYQTLEADYRHEVNKYKVKCEWCDRLFLPEKLKFHQKYFCGPDAERTDKQKQQLNNSDLKTEAAKRMKIGGVETSITIDPLNAIRRASMAHLHAKRKMRMAQGSAKEEEGEKEAAEDEKNRGGAASSTGPATAGKRKKQASCAGAAARTASSETPAKVGTGCWGRSLGSSETPAKQPKLQREGSASSSWGVSLQASVGSAALPLDLDGSGEEDSDLEIVASGAAGGGGSSSSSTGIKMEPAAIKMEVGGAAGASSAQCRLCGEASPVSRAPSGAYGEELPPDPGSEDDMEEGGMDFSASPLFRTRWNRVILDEAHRIKGRINSTAQASFHLKADVGRWCLSGTPLQNRVADVYSIIRFLRFYPYAHYFCTKKGCDCVSLHYRFDPETSTCRKCGHTKMQHRSYFATTVSNPVKKYGYFGAGKAAIERLRTDVLDRILLRRTKAERHDDLKLPPMHVRIRKDALSAEETDFYKAMYQNSLTDFDTYVEKGTVLHNYAHIFDLIMRLRQAVDHPYLIVHGSLRTEKGPIPTKSRSEKALGVCALCQDEFDDLSNRVVAQCGHAFHRDCVADYLQQAPELSSGGVGCPACFSPLTVSLEEQPADGDSAPTEAEGPADADAEAAPLTKRGPKVASIMQRIKTSEFKSSTKIEALMQELKRMMAEDPTSKALVFSQFITFLDLIEWRLKHEGVSCAKLLGSMSITSKNNMIIAFQTDPTLKVMLISLKAGGEGLNLQAANHIFLMDPWWNPASELQAMQRAHRIGQTRPVHCTRFICKDTIEEKIIELQEKKQAVFDCSVGNSNQALQRLTGEDIRFLFSQ